MPVVVVGLNHRTAPVELLERLAIGDEELPKALHQLLTYERVLEGAILSTCNRIEVYAVVSRFHGGAQDLRNFLAEFCHAAPEEFVDHLYTYHDDGALKHLFRVAAGVDSMVVGESEILGQVRRSFQAASVEGAVQRTLGYALRQALRVGKRARSETAIGRNPVSISSAAVELARRTFQPDGLKGKSVAVVGAGKMGRVAMLALRRAGASKVTVVNRSEDRGRIAAEDFGAQSAALEDLPRLLGTVDIVISSTTAPEAVVPEAMVREAPARRDDKPLFIVDIAVPRDVDAAVRDLPGVTLKDIDDLREVVETGMGGRLSEIGKVEAIIEEEVRHFVEWDRASEVGPALAALVKRAEETRVEELARVHGRLGELSDEQQRTIEQLTRRIVAKLLHGPLENAKDLAASKEGHRYLSMLRELFELDDDEDD